ncbi:hypothetical protein [uncultured Desulfosarcina sp.]|uniref:hypothetical protein n=1 Tax=uncultured Desulfosarcina sp. TaxID=218289 RepID=UPI0029C7BBED|nr:hypothetical protein [uncultured Desulfosarcina sp.]
MPGMYGYFGNNLQVGRKLSKRFQLSWNDCTEFSEDNHIIGAHAHFGKKAARKFGESNYVLVDGDANIYDSLFRYKCLNEMVNFKNSIPVNLKDSVAGNLVIFNNKTRILCIFADISGSIPLYYSLSNGSFVFSSLVKPIAQALKSQQDTIGIIENVCLKYYLSNRTAYKNIFRILPGQCIIFDLVSKEMNTYETSRAWIKDNTLKSKQQIVDNLINEINFSVSSIKEHNAKLALMFSGGWDSRIILSLLVSNSLPSICFSHGRSDSRELRIGKKICSYVNYPFFNMPFDLSLFNIDDRIDEFNKTENITSPEWYHAGKKLKEMGRDSAISGILGEIIGGQFSPFDYYPDWKKTITNQLLLNNYKFEKKINNRGLNFVRELLYTQIPKKKPWFISDDFWYSEKHLSEAVKHDIDKDITRILSRGITSPLKIIEAIKSECRGVQIYFPQIMSCRSFVDIYNIFGMSHLFTLISKIPMHLKVTNSLSKEIVRHYNSDLLKYPTGAILLNATSNIRLQELSKILIKFYEKVRWSLYFKTDGFFQYPNLEWDDYESFRKTDCLNTIVDNINNPIFDINKLVEFVQNIKQNKWHNRYFFAFYQIMRFYSIELLLKSK